MSESLFACMHNVDLVAANVRGKQVESLTHLVMARHRFSHNASFRRSLNPFAKLPKLEETFWRRLANKKTTGRQTNA